MQRQKNQRNNDREKRIAATVEGNQDGIAWPQPDQEIFPESIHNESSVIILQSSSQLSVQKSQTQIQAFKSQPDDVTDIGLRRSGGPDKVSFQLTNLAYRTIASISILLNFSSQPQLARYKYLALLEFLDDRKVFSLFSLD